MEENPQPQADVKGNGRTRQAQSEMRILHISDLHFGRRFDEDSWKGLCNLAATKLNPDLVLITGDLVDSPHRFSMARALKAVGEMKQALKCDVVVVPGNHDTRFLGLVPVKWANPFLLLAAAAAAWAVFFLAPGRLAPPWVWLAAAAGLTTLFALRLFFVDFSKKFKDYLAPDNRYHRPGLVDIYAFDSASHALLGARGRIPKRQFVDAQGNRIKPRAADAPAADGGGAAGQEAYPIAILHHHPLPIPYDDAHEPLMVVDNAGSFLSEVSKLGVRLVLHGHKHHRHFSRTTINAGGKREHEVAVLSTGTPTRRGRSDGSEHHFNFLLLDAQGSMKFTPYVANREGTFEEQGARDVEMPRLAEKRFYDASVQRHGMRCAANVVTVEITPDGDLSFRQEFHQFKVLRDDAARDDMPMTLDVRVGTGHIDDFYADDLGDNPPVSVRMVESGRRELIRRQGRIAFEKTVTPEDAPLDFYSQYHSLNGFAMSVSQHREMYPADTGEYTEHVEHHFQPAPPEELDIVVKFPTGFRIAGDPRLEVLDGNARSAVYERKYRDCLKYYPNINVAVARVEHPPTNLAFRVKWTLTDEPPPGGAPADRLEGKVEEIAEALLSASARPELTKKLRSLLEAIGVIARKEFKLDADDPIELSLMAYHHGERALRIAAASFPLDDALRQFRLKYGDGIAGRAYKMNKGRVFIRRQAEVKKTPSYYYPLDGKPYDLKQSEGIEEVIISLPLRHPGDEQLVYAVISISSRKPSSKLQNAKETRIAEDTSTFRQAVDEACLLILSDLL